MPLTSTVGSEAAATELIWQGWHNYQHGTFLLVVLVYALCISLLAFARLRDFYEIAIVASIAIILSLVYALYATVKSMSRNAAMRKEGSRYSVFNNIYYLVMIGLLFVIFLLVVSQFRTGLLGKLASPVVA